MKLPFRSSTLVSLAVFALAIFSPAHAENFSGSRHIFADSIKEVGGNARITSTTLSSVERTTQIRFVVSLKMRNMDELEARLGAGQLIPQADMEANYLPSSQEFQSVRSWLVSQGFIVTQEDPNHTNIFVRGTAAQVEASLGATFGKVATADGEFVSAISAPTLPEEISDSVLSINGLQPHIRMHHQGSGPLKIPQYPLAVGPADILAAYNAPSSLTGAGQTIAVIMDATVRTSDLTTFYSAIGSSQTAANVTTILVDGGPSAADQVDAQVEASLDVEWTSGMAFGAKVRLYAIPYGTFQEILAACSQILADAPANHITVVSMSYAGIEQNYSSALLHSYSQVFAQLAAAGITCVAGSGDGGSNPNTNGTLGYNSTNPLEVEYPASDPYVTGVGGTTITFAANTYANIGEAAWNTFPASGPVAGKTYAASGGGVSSVFARPSWQTDGGTILKNSNRCVPDVSGFASAIIPPFPTPSPSDGNSGGFFVMNGLLAAGGETSLSAPVWAGIVALLNQARANAGESPIGLLGPVLYPLHGTTALNDMTVGSNGAYSAGPGYDLCSGLGSPNIAILAAALTGSPIISAQPQSQTMETGATLVLTVNAQSGISSPPYSSAPISYQWSLNGSAISGGTNSSLLITNTSASNAGTYTCLVSNAYGSATSSAATISVVTSSDPGRLTNLSVNTTIPAGNNTLTLGFVIGGAGTSGPENLLIRATGPTFAQFLPPGIPAMPDPELAVFNPSQAVIASNAGWGQPLSNQQAVTAADALTGAFALPDPTSKDSATVVALTPNSYGYTVQIGSVSGTAGSVLAELYDATANYTTAVPHLINLSCKFQVAANGTLTAGLWISGTTSKTMLIRVSGPNLATLVPPGTVLMPDPQMKVFNATEQIASNAGWGGNPQIAAAAASVYAFAFTNPASTDSAVLVTLPPGGYTVQASSMSGTTGTALVEVYEVP